MNTTDRYTIISADAHGGLPCEEYRPYLDPKYYPQFDEFLAERNANRDEQMKLNYDYITQWETQHEEGLRGAYDAEQRDKEMDADGVAAEVIFPDADAITGMESPPFGAGLSAGTIEDPELAFAGARAPACLRRGQERRWADSRGRVRGRRRDRERLARRKVSAARDPGRIDRRALAVA